MQHRAKRRVHLPVQRLYVWPLVDGWLAVSLADVCLVPARTSRISTLTPHTISNTETLMRLTGHMRFSSLDVEDFTGPSREVSC